jgi:hypothetical protein
MGSLKAGGCKDKKCEKRFDLDSLFCYKEKLVERE